MLFAEGKEGRIIFQSICLGVVYGCFRMSNGKVRNQAWVRIASSSSEDAMDMNVLCKCSAMMTGECEVSLISPFMQGQTSVISGMTRGLEDIVFIDEGGSKIRVIERLDGNETLSIGRRQVDEARTDRYNTRRGNSCCEPYW